MLRSSGGADQNAVLGAPGRIRDKLRSRMLKRRLRDPNTRAAITRPRDLDLVKEDLIAGRRMQAAAADRVGIGSGCEPAGLARWAPRSGVGVGGLLSLRRFAWIGVALSAGARSGSARRRHFCAFALCASAFPRRRSGWLSALPRHQSDAARVDWPRSLSPPAPRARRGVQRLPPAHRGRPG